MILAKDIRTILRGDGVIWAIFFVLTACSLLAVYSATGSMAFQTYGGPTSAFFVKQLLITVLAVGVTWGLSRMHYQTFMKLAPYLLVISMIILAATLLVGVESSSARRWLKLPFTELTIQPSEFAKLALIVFVAKTISSRQEQIKDFKEGLVPIILPIVLVCLLIAPADLSTAGILFATCAAMMFVGRIQIRYIGALLVAAAIGFGLLLVIGNFLPEHVRVATWISRINEFIGVSGDEYQITQSKIAIASGEFFGVGLGNSVQRNFLPSPYADFIYAIICEEWGLIGGVTIIVLYMVMLFRCVRLATQCNMTFGLLLAIGLCFLLVIQAFANIAVSVDLVPVTGLTLPLVSKGGTSLVFSSMAFGIILSVSSYIERNPKSAAADAGHH